MPVSAAHIRAVIDGYLHDRPDQASCLAPVLSLLGRGVDLTDRRQWAGHLTASAIVVNPQGRILLVQHVKYDRFLQPGGHLEVSDTTLAGAAVRELGEETGVRDVQPLTTGPLHISVHPIPPWPQSGELAHVHFDVRFAYASTCDIGALQLDEVRSARWMAPADLTDPSLREALALMPEPTS